MMAAMTSADGLALIIREYRDGDELACHACAVELQDAGRSIDPRLRPGEAMADEYLAQMHARCRSNAGAIIVAEQGDTIVGLVMILARVPFESLDDPPGDYAYVAELVVLEGFRGQGIGRALLRAAEGYARDAGAVELRIGVLSENRVARRLYLEEGFLPYSEMLAKALDR